MLLYFIIFHIAISELSSATLPKIVDWANRAWCPMKDKCQGDSVASTDNLVLIDLFEQSDLINSLKLKGRVFICYFSAGTLEDYRPDKDSFPKSTIYGKMAEWEGEYWLDITKWELLKPIMQNRIDMGVAAGCDGFEFDNVDFYSGGDTQKLYDTTLLTEKQLAYNIWLAESVRAKGKFAFLKNTIGLIPQLISYFDGAINESCQKFNECSEYSVFINAGKPVLATEYEGVFDEICKNALEYSFNQLVYDSFNLGHWKKCASPAAFITLSYLFILVVLLILLIIN